MTSALRPSRQVLVVATAVLALLGPACNGRSSTESRRIKALESEMKTTRETSDALAAKVAALEGNGPAVANDLASVKASIDELRAGIASLQKDVKSAQDQAAAASRKASDVDAKVGSLGGKLDEVDRALKAVRDKLDRYIVAHP
jgi:chromosome segregation ATPase